jgi:hypothetical protein
MSAAPYQYIEAVVPAGQSTSNVIDLTKCLGFILECPPILAGLTDAGILHSSTGVEGTFRKLTLYSDPTMDYVVPLSALRAIPMDTMNTQFLGFIKLNCSGTATSAVTFKLGYKEAS